MQFTITDETGNDLSFTFKRSTNYQQLTKKKKKVKFLC